MQLQYDQSQQPPKKLKVTTKEPYNVTHVTSKKLISEGLTLAFDHTNQYVAVGCKNGSRMLYSISENKFIEKYDSVSETAITSVKWRPMNNSKFNILASADGDGNLSYWHAPSLKKIFNVHQADNCIHAVDFSPKGVNFVTGGKDADIRVYDQETKSVVTTFKRASWNTLGHDNRVFAVKYVDDNTIISGGWDAVVHIWDARQGRSIRHFYGAHVSGESIDYRDGKILIGCYAAKNQLQIWSFNKATKMQEIDWTGNVDEAQYLYTAAYSKYNYNLFAAGSTGSHSEVRIYEENEGKLPKVVTNIEELHDGCFSLGFNPKSGLMAFTTPNHGFYVYNITKN